ncbi:MAG TPA: Fe-S cluster assembly protein SufD [Egicoccus sp.]|nr:Fe-S cluster assembly protein SufD [Egicoccus sp.]HSK22739.1 Fe-S cluster assembly protein SufD [Egicoccus sp.]
MTTSLPTPVSSTLDGLTEDAVRAIAAGEPDWLVDRRLAATKRYLDQSWPDSRKDEFWRSTPFAKRFDTSLPLMTGMVDTGSGADASVPTSLVASLELTTAQVRIVDGELVEATVPAALAEQGVVVTDLRTAAEEHADLVREHLGSLTTSGEGSGANEDRTISVNDAAWTAGAFIHVPAEVELTDPIGVHIHVSRVGAHLPRVLAVLGHHAKATIYLEHTSDEGVNALVDEVVEVIAMDAAKVDMVSLHEWAMGVAHLALHKVGAHRDAEVRHSAIVAGGATVRLRPECDLLGPGASVRPLGVYYADEGQWFDLQPYVRHLAPKATSDVLYKGALQGKSRTVFRGNVFVHKDAIGTVTDENNRSLILTEGARADATPFLEIECADIAAGHGSATGQIDARHLFYLEARGIPRAQALRMLVHGFFREVLTEIDLPGIEERALAHIERELAATDLDRLGINDAALRDELS